MVQADYEALDAEKRRKDKVIEDAHWRLDKEKKKLADAAKKEADKQEATRKMHAAHAERAEDIKRHKAAEYQEWLDKMTAKREEEEAAIIAAGGTVVERKQWMKAAGQLALLGSNMSEEWSRASSEKDALGETGAERAARLEGERCTTPLEAWSKGDRLYSNR